MQCTKCQANINDGVKFCPKCGTPAQKTPSNDTKSCPQCGETNPLSAKFCKKDGYRFDTTIDEINKPEIKSDQLICPQCGTENSVNAKFCKKDGFALQGKSAPTPKLEPEPIVQSASSILGDTPQNHEAPVDTVTTPVVCKKSNKGLIIGMLTVLIISASGYAYWLGYFGNRQGSVQEKINAELVAKGFEDVQITIDQDWNASLSGKVLKQTDKDQLQELTKAHGELKNISLDMVQALPNIETLEQAIISALSSNGINEHTVVVDSEDYTATIWGNLKTAVQQDMAISIAKSIEGIKDARYEVEKSTQTTETSPEPTPQIASPKTQIQPVVSQKEPTAINRPTTSKPATQTEQPINEATQESTAGSEAEKKPSNISESFSELKDKLNKLDALKVRPITQEEKDKKFCPIPGQNC